MQYGVKSTCNSQLVDDPSHKWAWVWRVTPYRLWPSLESLLRFAYALRWEGRSLFGRIQILLSRKQWGLDLGPEYVTLLDGRRLRNKRTAARSYGIEELASCYPWASMFDLELFLKGFDLGEQYTQSSLRSAEPEPFETGTFAALD
jgi:hypothetical protein